MLIVPGKQKVLGPEDPLDCCLYRKTRKCFTKLQRYYCFNALEGEFLFSTFMGACFDFFGKNITVGWGHQGSLQS